MSAGLGTTREYPVAFADLAAALRDRWQALVEASELPLHRCATLNLVAVTTPERLPGLREDFEALVGRQPCRAFFLVFSKDAAEPRATYFAGVEIETSSRSVRYERLTFHCTEADLPRVESLIRPHALDDLPTVLLTLGSPPCSAAALARLARTATLHVFDSASLDEPETELQVLRDACPRHRDLAWLRLSPWRRALARAFEHVAWREGTPVRAVIRFGAGDVGARTSSRLLADWLVERLEAEIELLADASHSTPDAQPAELSVTVGDSRILLGHCCDRPRIRTRIELEGVCLVPFETPASKSCRGTLAAAAADGA